MPTPDPNIRLSNADREALIGRLHAATEEGRLDLDEFAERSTQVYEAKTFADVERLLADLPEDDRALAVPTRRKAVSDVPEIVLDPKYSRLKREGAWTVPQRIVVKPEYTSVVLDCRHAEFTSDEIDVEVELKYSRLKLILPRGASAVDDGVRMEGGRVTNRAVKPGAGPRFRLSGRIEYAQITVRYERRFLWWRW